MDIKIPNTSIDKVEGKRVDEKLRLFTHLRVAGKVVKKDMKRQLLEKIFGISAHAIRR